MGMSVVRYAKQQGGEPQWGVLSEGIIRRLPWEDDQLRSVIENLEDRLAAGAGTDAGQESPLDDVVLYSPLTSDSRLLCQGLNYAEHQAEAGMQKRAIDPEDNLIFMKSSASLSGPRDPIRRPTGCELLDYEAELGLVIRKPIQESTTVTEEALHQHVAGLLICNDVSARDQQIGAPGLQWFKGKSYRTFCPAGPVLYLLDANEMEYLDRLEVRLWVNGSLRQSASTAQLLHKPADTLSYVSEFANLAPGDCLLTGTPGGVALRMNPKTALATLLNMTRDSRRREKFRAAQRGNPKYLKNGDIVEIEIASEDGHIHLGRQRNEVVAG